MYSNTCWILFTVKKETAKEKMLKEEERILESVAEKKGTILNVFYNCWEKKCHMAWLNDK